MKTPEEFKKHVDDFLNYLKDSGLNPEESMKVMRAAFFIILYEHVHPLEHRLEIIDSLRVGMLHFEEKDKKENDAKRRDT